MPDDIDPKTGIFQPPRSFPPMASIEPRKALQDTAYRLNYAMHVIECEADEVESAITEEEPEHPNISALSQAFMCLSAAQTQIAAAIKILENKA
jgi:hypothetical protein